MPVKVSGGQVSGPALAYTLQHAVHNKHCPGIYVLWILQGFAL